LTQFERPSAPEISFFEISTLLAIEAFRDHRCDIAVIEVGLGGRLDATTALPANLSVITRIAHDHTHMLGDTLAQIAREKAGIIRPGVRVIVGSRASVAQRVIGAQARRLSAPLDLIERDFRAIPVGGRVAFEMGAIKLPPVRLALPGAHQHDNAALAFAALCRVRELGFRVPRYALTHALTKVHWPARLETIAGKPNVLLDAAHNPDGCRALADFLAQQKQRPRVLIFGALADKDYPKMLRALAPHIEHVIYVQPDIARALPARELQRVLPGVAADSPADGLQRANRAAGSGGLVVVAGSIFVVAELRARLLRVGSDPLIRM
jgi:dihydrofolate synthase / folylpolyglutamate synthase